MGRPHPSSLISPSTSVYAQDELYLHFCSGFDPEPLAEQLSSHTPVPIPYAAPVNWGQWATIAFVAITFIASIRHLLPVLQSRWTWAALTIIVSLVMTSGFMFVRIRDMPFTAQDGNWIAAGYSNQYGQETQVVAMLCTSYNAALTVLYV